MKNKFFLFSVFSFLALSIGFSIHFLWIKSIVQSDIYSYIGNYIFSVLTFAMLLLLNKKFPSILGFVYMGGSLLKFALFFIFLYPIIHQDGQIIMSEKIAFIVPYTISVALELWFLIKELDKQ